MQICPLWINTLLLILTVFWIYTLNINYIDLSYIFQNVWAEVAEKLIWRLAQLVVGFHQLSFLGFYK